MLTNEITFCRGLKPLLTRWQGAGFERELRKLSRVLEAGNAAQAEKMVKHKILEQHVEVPDFCEDCWLESRKGSNCIPIRCCSHLFCVLVVVIVVVLRRVGDCPPAPTARHCLQATRLIQRALACISEAGCCSQLCVLNRKQLVFRPSAAQPGRPCGVMHVSPRWGTSAQMGVKAQGVVVYVVT